MSALGPIDLAILAEDEALLDALGAGQPPATDDAITRAFAGLRAELEAECRTLSPFRGQESAIWHRPGRRILALTAGVALALSGTGVAAASSSPGAPLYGLHEALGRLLPEPSHAARDRATSRLDRAAALLTAAGAAPVTPAQKAAIDRALLAATTATDEVTDPADQAALFGRLHALDAASTRVQMAPPTTPKPAKLQPPSTHQGGASPSGQPSSPAAVSGGEGPATEPGGAGPAPGGVTGGAAGQGSLPQGGPGQLAPSSGQHDTGGAGEGNTGRGGTSVPGTRGDKGGQATTSKDGSDGKAGHPTTDTGSAGNN